MRLRAALGGRRWPAAHRQACRGIGATANGSWFPVSANAKNHHQVVMERHLENVVEKLAFSRDESRRHLASCYPEFSPAIFAAVLVPVAAFAFRDFIVGFHKRGVIRDVTDPAPRGMALAPVGGVPRSLLGRVKFLARAWHCFRFGHFGQAALAGHFVASAGAVPFGIGVLIQAACRRAIILTVHVLAATDG